MNQSQHDVIERITERYRGCLIELHERRQGVIVEIVGTSGMARPRRVSVGICMVTPDGRTRDDESVRRR